MNFMNFIFFSKFLNYLIITKNIAKLRLFLPDFIKLLFVALFYFKPKNFY